MSKQRIGLIGIGAMGRGVAANLLAKGFDVSGFDVRPEAGEWLRGKGGHVAADLPSLAGECRTLISFVVNDAQTEDVLFGDKGLVGQRGVICFECFKRGNRHVLVFNQRQHGLAQTKQVPVRHLWLSAIGIAPLPIN